MEQARTKSGYAVNKCCASCTYKQFASEEQRRCELSGFKHSPLHVCDRWAMRATLAKL